ncbi:MAG: hypothetical protein V4490_00270 [Pseudomonadota bacterium]
MHRTPTFFFTDLNPALIKSAREFSMAANTFNAPVALRPIASKNPQEQYDKAHKSLKSVLKQIKSFGKLLRSELRKMEKLSSDSFSIYAPNLTSLNDALNLLVKTPMEQELFDLISDVLASHQRTVLIFKNLSENDPGIAIYASKLSNWAKEVTDILRNAISNSSHETMMMQVFEAPKYFVTAVYEHQFTTFHERLTERSGWFNEKFSDLANQAIRRDSVCSDLNKRAYEEAKELLINILNSLSKTAGRLAPLVKDAPNLSFADALQSDMQTIEQYRNAMQAIEKDPQQYLDEHPKLLKQPTVPQSFVQSVAARASLAASATVDIACAAARDAPAILYFGANILRVEFSGEQAKSMGEYVAGGQDPASETRSLAQSLLP